MKPTTGDGSRIFADGIQQSSKDIGSVYDAEKYERYNRKDILRARRAVIDNPKGTLTAKGLLDGVEIDPDLLKPKSDGGDFIETDYR